MKTVNRFLNYVRYGMSSKLVAAGVFVLAVAGLVTANVVNNQTPAYAADCTANAIVKCGVSSAGQLAANYNQNAHGDLQNILHAYGINGNNIGQMVEGVAYKDGRIVVGGKTVATDSWSIGRSPKAKSVKKVIAGKTYYNDASSNVFRSNSLSVLVLMNGDQFVSAVIKDCGNPMTGKPTPPEPKPQPPVAQCDSLTLSMIDRTRFQVSSSGSAANGASITQVRYDVTNSAGAVVTTKTVGAANTTTELAVDQPGTYNVRATMITTIGERTSESCVKPVTIKPEPAKPVYKCDMLSANLVGKAEDRTFNYTLSYTAEGGATLQTVDFDFGDGQSKKGVTPAQLNDVQHQYAKEGTYTTKATLNFNVAGGVQSVDCQVVVKAVPDVCPTNPSLPKDSPECEPCPIPGYENLPKDSPKCKETPVTPPAEIPSTGPADFLGGALGIGSITGSGIYWLRSRRDLLGSLLNR